ncbi:Signal-transduction histidine kinase senX3 [Eubacteriaceae bacterium CHKCI004]|nr:Signal-transduction histidine kinase senX3 [Eubacteriaceae bacterium CHKCI004]
MEKFMICMAVLAAAVGIAIVCIRRYYRKRMQAATQMLLERLDRAIGGEMQEEIFDESVDAAVTERLNRLLELTNMHQEQAETERDTIKSIISNITHQIRTPVTNIMLYTGLLQEIVAALGQDGGVTENISHLLLKLQKQADKLDFFMKELVKSTYTEQEMISLHPEMTDVQEIVAAACQTVELSAMKKGIVIAVQSAGDVQQHGKEETADGILCYADRKWTVEALANVLDNAVKYSPSGSRIDVRLRTGESFLCVEVEDRGCGIREEEQGRIFERFYRAEEVSAEPGFGIGLYLVREVLSRQGGYARVKSAPGEGTTMYLYLSRYVAGAGSPHF